MLLCLLRVFKLSKNKVWKFLLIRLVLVNCSIATSQSSSQLIESEALVIWSLSETTLLGELTSPCVIVKFKPLMITLGD